MNYLVLVSFNLITRVSDARFSMTEVMKDSIGDHSEMINFVNCKQYRKNLLESLSHNAQELFNFKIRKYDGGRRINGFP